MGFFENDADNVWRAIETWDPGTAFSEKACRDSLLRYLRKQFPKKKFIPEHRIGRGKADIYVNFEDWTSLGAQVVIELKYSLKTNAEYHRLVGQVGDYVGIGKAEVIVVLCGETKPELILLVEQRMRDLTKDRSFWKGYVVPKPFTARGKNGRFVAVQVGQQ